MKNTFNFCAFYKRFENHYPDKPRPSHSFLEWLIGFIEGDGSLSILKSKQLLELAIGLHTSDKPALEYIVSHLGLGNITQFSKTCYYRVTNLKDISIIILPLNRQIIIPKFYKRFVIFLAKYNERVNNFGAQSKTKAIGNIDLIPYEEVQRRPSLNDAWISGFTDAEGCFHVRRRNDRWSYYFQLGSARGS